MCKQCFMWHHKKGHISLFFGKFLALFKVIQKNKEGLWRIKGITMAQWTNINRNNRFVNPPPLSWMSEISGAVHLALLGLMAGSRQEKCRWISKILKLTVDWNIRFLLCLAKMQHHYSNTNAFQAIFTGKVYCKDIFKVQRFTKPYDFLPIPN